MKVLNNIVTTGVLIAVVIWLYLMLRPSRNRYAQPPLDINVIEPNK
jgi:hypothetical protein